METIISTQYYRHPKLATFYALTTTDAAPMPERNTTQEIKSGDSVTIRPIENTPLLKFDYFKIIGVGGETTETISHDNPYTFIMPDNNVKIVVVYQSATAANIQPSKTVTPTDKQQTVTPDSGYDAMAQVIVNAAPAPTIDALAITPTASEQIFTAPADLDGYNPVVVSATPTEQRIFTANGVYTPTAGKFIDSVTVNVPGESANIQPSKTVTPTDKQQTVTPDSGYDAMAQVIVESVPVDANNTFTENGTYTPEIGKYFSEININVSGGTSAAFKTWTYIPTELIGTGGGHVTTAVELINDAFISEHYNDNTLLITMYPINDVTSERSISTPVCSAFIFARANINSGITISIKNATYTSDGATMTTIVNNPLIRDTDGTYGQFKITSNGSLIFYNSTRNYLNPATTYQIIAQTGVNYV